MNINRVFDKAAEEIEGQLENGDLTPEQYQKEMRELRGQYEEAIEHETERYREDLRGGW
jgi:hypothetical protein